MKTLRGVIVPGARHHNVDPSVTVLLPPCTAGRPTATKVKRNAKAYS